MFNLKYRQKHKTFDYKTRFYDAEKEALQERLARYNQDGKDQDVESIKHNIREGLRSGISPSDKNYRSTLVNQSNLRLLGIVVVLCVVVYIILMSEQVISIIKNM